MRGGAAVAVRVRLGLRWRSAVAGGTATAAQVTAGGTAAESQVEFGYG